MVHLLRISFEQFLYKNQYEAHICSILVGRGRMLQRQQLFCSCAISIHEMINNAFAHSYYEEDTGTHH